MNCNGCGEQLPEYCRCDFTTPTINERMECCEKCDDYIVEDDRHVCSNTHCPCHTTDKRIEEIVEEFGQRFPNVRIGKLDNTEDNLLQWLRTTLTSFKEKGREELRAELREKVGRLWQHVPQENLSKMVMNGTMISRKDVLALLTPPITKREEE